MKKSSLFFLYIVAIMGILGFTNLDDVDDPRFITHQIDLKKQDLKMYRQNSDGINYKNHFYLKKALEADNKRLLFAMNGGMYLRDGSPQGLYIEDGKIKAPLDTIRKGFGNFYLQPNGIFFITRDKKGVVCQTSEYEFNSSISYATQSGPMLVINNRIHPVFVKDSKHYNIRNGVGVLPNGELLFAMSKDTITLYDFANFFKNKGCKNALYLDGAISKTYLPQKNWEQLDGNFGVIIAETTNMN